LTQEHNILRTQSESDACRFGWSIGYLVPDFLRDQIANAMLFKKGGRHVFSRRRQLTNATESLEFRQLLTSVYENTVVVGNPIAYWRLGDAAPITDSSVNAHSGTLLNSPSLGQAH